MLAGDPSELAVRVGELESRLRSIDGEAVNVDSAGDQVLAGHGDAGSHTIRPEDSGCESRRQDPTVRGMSKSPVFSAPADDPALLAAMERARTTFKYLWRELTWEYRRIIPGVDVSGV